MQMALAMTRNITTVEVKLVNWMHSRRSGGSCSDKFERLVTHIVPTAKAETGPAGM